MLRLTFITLCLSGVLTHFANLFEENPKLDKLQIWKVPVMDFSQSISLKPYAPEVGNQGTDKACVAYAVSFAMTIQKAITEKVRQFSEFDNKEFSPYFIYNQLNNGDCNGLLSLIDAADFVKEKGNILSLDFGKNEKNCKVRPTPMQLKEAKQNRINGYTLLFRKESSNRQKITAVKAALTKQIPVVLSMNIRKNFFHLKGGIYWWPDLIGSNQTLAGRHSLIIIGYDDERQAFELMNSMGKKWGINGFAWIKYDKFLQQANYAVCLKDLHKLSVIYKIQLMTSIHKNFRQSELNKVKHLGEIEILPKMVGQKK